MTRDDIQELYFIVSIKHVPSIMRLGVLSHNKAKDAEVRFDPIDDPEVQERRKNKKIPGTNKWLHDYANLYFDAHNPMLSAVRNKNDSICVLRIKKDVLALDDVIITDQNASRDCWFKSVSEGLPLLKHDEVFAEFWTNRDDPMEEYRLKGIKCAEVLILRCVHPDYVFAAYVANNTALNNFGQVSTLPVQINVNLFF